MDYLISNEANGDIQKIWIYTLNNWSAEQADRYLNFLLDEIEYIAQNPKSGSGYGHVRKEYMRIRMKSHFIFYKINRGKNRVEVIRILHQQMDIKSRLKE